MDTRYNLFRYAPVEAQGSCTFLRGLAMHDNLQGYAYEARRNLCSTCSLEDIVAKVPAINRAVISMRA